MKSVLKRPESLKFLRYQKLYKIQSLFPKMQKEQIYRYRSFLPMQPLYRKYLKILQGSAMGFAALGQTAQAAALVNQVRARVGLAAISSSLSQEQMKAAVLKERRLELAFEGFRWFDLVRNDKAIETMNTLNARDEGRLPRVYPLTENSSIYPVPQTELENNKKLTQNPGY